MSESTYSIAVRRPTGAVSWWIAAFAIAIHALAFAIIFAQVSTATSTRITVGSVEVVLAVVALGGFVTYVRHREDAAGEIPFDWWDVPGRRLWPAALIRFYGGALLPLALVLGTVGAVTMAQGIGEATISAQATIAEGPRVDHTVATWRLDKNSSRSDFDDEVVRAEDADHLSARLGETVLLTGPWGGVELLTIESIETKTYTTVDKAPLFAGAPTSSEEKCLVVLGSQRTTDRKHHELDYFLTRDPARQQVRNGVPVSDGHAPAPYFKTSHDSLPGSDDCPAATAVNQGYRDVTVDPRATLSDGKFLVKFHESWTWGAGDDPLYLGIATSDGTIVYWDVTGAV